MKIEITLQDQVIELIAKKVAECLKPLIAESGQGKGDGEILTAEEAAEFLKTSKGQIYQWVDNARHGLGDFPYLKAGRLLRFSKTDLIQWLKESKSRQMC